MESSVDTMLAKVPGSPGYLLLRSQIDQKTGRLTHVEHEPTGGRTPRNFGIDPTGRFLLAANQGTHRVVVFRIDGKTGALSPTGHHVHVPSPVCVKFP